MEYSNPELCIAVRLLPPTLDEEGFLAQGKIHAEALKSGFRNLYYQRGTRDVKLFEKPAYSTAYFEFNSVAQASKARDQLHEKIFLEPGTDDNMSCQCVKPIFGKVYPLPVARDVKVDHGSMFEMFSKLREENGQSVLLKAIMDEQKVAQKKLRLEKKKLKKLKADSIVSKQKQDDVPKKSKRKKAKSSKDATVSASDTTSTKLLRSQRSKAKKVAKKLAAQEKAGQSSEKTGQPTEKAGQPTEKTRQPTEKDTSRSKRNKSNPSLAANLPAKENSNEQSSEKENTKQTSNPETSKSQSNGNETSLKPKSKRKRKHEKKATLDNADALVS